MWFFCVIWEQFSAQGDQKMQEKLNLEFVRV